MALGVLPLLLVQAASQTYPEFSRSYAPLTGFERGCEGWSSELGDTYPAAWLAWKGHSYWWSKDAFCGSTCGDNTASDYCGYATALVDITNDTVAIHLVLYDNYWWALGFGTDQIDGTSFIIIHTPLHTSL